jgi:predicted transcriptional regulator
VAKEAVTFRMAPEKRARLDDVAASLGQDRSQAIDQAIDAYLDFHEWQLQQIKAGLADAESGRFVPDADMDKIWRRFTSPE